MRVNQWRKEPHRRLLEVFAIGPADADDCEHGAVAHGAAETSLGVGGVEHEIADFGQRAAAPFLKLVVELGGEARDLGGGNFASAEFPHDGLDTAD